MVWEENSPICLHMQLIAILSRIGVFFIKIAIKSIHYRLNLGQVIDKPTRVISKGCKHH